MDKKRDEANVLNPLISHNGVVQAILIVIILIAMAAAITTGYFYYRHQVERNTSFSSDIQSLDKRISTVEKITEPLGKRINLTVPSVQKIDHVYFVAKLSTKKHLTGVKVKGIIINSSALVHKNATFRIIIGDQSREFTVSKISPGSSNKFEVEIPDIPLENAQTAEIMNLSSSVSYYVD